MQAIKYRITALSPLVFTSNTGDPNMVATLDYIPGTHLMGLFANEYIKRKNLQGMAEEDEKFYQWFLKGELKFLNAYITASNNHSIDVLYPVPLSIQKEKHGDEAYYDLLLFDDEEKQTKSLEGKYGKLTENSIKIGTVKKSINFHHARERERGVAKKGIIFNYESIDEDQIFEGFILGSEASLKEFKEMFSEGIHYLGRSRSNQYGKIKFEIITKEPFNFESEIKDFTIEPGEVVLTLLSDTIIYNENGFSVTDVREFEKAIGCPVKKAFIRASEEEGFLSVWKLKTPLEVCFKAGSSFLIEVKEEDIARLKELQKNGIGRLTNLGFGRFVIGYQTEEEITESDKENKKPSKPKLPQPNSLRKILLSLTEDFILSWTQRLAIEKAEEFEYLPPKSLISKLQKAASEDALDKLLSNLKNTAKNHLERCRTKDKTLLEFLSDFLNNSYKDELDKISKTFNVEACLNEAQLSMDELPEFKIKRAYLTTFLNTLRKTAK